MSEEEKLLNNLKDYLNYLKGKNLMTSFKFNIVALLENSISLIEKQQKEIEKLNFENHMVKKWNEQLDKNCISRDKIREFIKKELPDDELMKWNIFYDVDGIDLRKKLENILEEN